MLQNTNLTCCKTHISFGTDDLDEFTALVQNNKKSIYTDQSNCEDMNPVDKLLWLPTRTQIGLRSLYK